MSQKARPASPKRAPRDESPDSLLDESPRVAKKAPKVTRKSPKKKSPRKAEKSDEEEKSGNEEEKQEVDEDEDILLSEEEGSDAEEESDTEEEKDEPAIEVKLRPHQVPRFERMLQQGKTESILADYSLMGAGKTPLTCAYAQYYDYPLLVVCPRGAIGVWKRETKKYGIRTIAILSHDTLKSTRRKSKRGGPVRTELKHGFLERVDRVTEKGIKKSGFEVTEKMKKLIGEGVLVVVDEAHHARNHTTMRFKAIQAITGYLARHESPSKVLFLTGSPMDKKEQAESYLRLFGVMESPKFFIKSGGVMVPSAAGELVDYCRVVDKKETEKILDEIPLTNKNKADLCHAFFTRIISIKSGGYMSLAFCGDYYNSFWKIEGADRKMLDEGINELAAVSGFDPTREAIYRAPGEKAGFSWTPALRKIDQGKETAMIRAAIHFLEENPNEKVVIAANYLSTISKLMKELKKYKPIRLQGKGMKLEERDAAVAKFQEHNLDHRLLIMSIAVGAESINLHDTTPDRRYHRTMLIFPGISFFKIFQAGGRINREGVAGSVHLLYALDEGGDVKKIKEEKIHHALERKGGVMQDVLKKSTGAQTPEMYSVYREGQKA